MHVKRHLNRLFGSFRSTVKNKRPFVGEAGQSQWELVDHENDLTPKTEVTLAQVGQLGKFGQGSQLDSHKSENYVIPLPAKIVLSSVQTLQNVKKPSLLKRTWSSRSRKNAAIHTTLEENRIPEFLIEENLAGVVEEINATIGLMNQYTLHNSLNYNPSLDVNGFADTTSAIKNESNGIEYYPREDECDDKWWVVANTESTHSFSDPNEFEPRWECFEHDFNKGQDTQETSDTTITECTLEAQAPVEVDTKTFIEAMEANIVSANLTLTLPEMEENRYHFHLPKESTLRRSGRRLYNRILRRKQSEVDKQDPKFYDNIEETKSIGANRSITLTGGWITRSFRKIVRRKNNVGKEITFTDSYNHNSTPQESRNSIKRNQIAVLSKDGPISRRFKKGFRSFGKSMAAASSVMPLPCEHPHPQDTSYPQVYYEDEDAIYEFRRYCQSQEWNRVQKERKYQVGYCQ